jgi:hypothetical protein
VCFKIIPKKKKPAALFAYKVLERVHSGDGLFSPHYNNGMPWVIGQTRAAGGKPYRNGDKATQGIYVYATLKAARATLKAARATLKAARDVGAHTSWRHAVVRVKVLPQDFLFEGRGETSPQNPAGKIVRTYKKVTMDKVYPPPLAPGQWTVLSFKLI